MKLNYVTHMMKMESMILMGKLDQVEDDSDEMQQTLITHYQRSMARYNAAQSIRTTYTLMLEILHKVNIIGNIFDKKSSELRRDSS